VSPFRLRRRCQLAATDPRRQRLVRLCGGIRATERSFQIIHRLSEDRRDVRRRLLSRGLPRLRLCNPSRQSHLPRLVPAAEGGGVDAMLDHGHDPAPCGFCQPFARGFEGIFALRASHLGRERDLELVDQVIAAQNAPKAIRDPVSRPGIA
jgi:hypothetical protein